jgi:uncharacterized protein YecE (DUF72 family)
MGMPGRKSHRVRVGCSGWNYDDWRGRLYPEKLPKRRWLERYAESFEAVEVNSTFYRLASEEAVKRWVEQTPPGFELTIKASRYMTHKWRLRDTERLVERFVEPLKPLVDAGRMGPVLWQLPANFRRDDDRLAGALAALPEGRHCFEFRDASWFAEPVMEMLREAGVALVIGDHPERPFQTHELTTDWSLVRFHHGHRGRRGNYSASELDEWAKRITRWRREADVYAFFNNQSEGFALPNATALRDALGAGPR